MKRVFLAIVVAMVLAVGSQFAVAVVFVDENFDGYTNAANLSATWRPDTGNGITPTAGPIGILVPCISGDPCPPAPFDGSGDAGVTPPVLPQAPGDLAAAFSTSGGINEYDNDGNGATLPFELTPTATESVRYSADIFDFVNGNRRFSVGLRNDSIDRDLGTAGFQAGMNLVEMGFFNANTFDPLDPINAPPNTPTLNVPSTGYAYRLQLWGGYGGSLVRQPDWQYFPLDIAFDDPGVDHNGDGRFGNGDGRVSPVDVGPGWHTFTTTIGESEVKFELDLFRDGSIDSTVVWEMVLAKDPANPTVVAPFTSLRMGGPSGVTMNVETMTDNILLETITVGGIDGDFNNDGLYNCADIDSLVNDIANGTNTGSFDLTGDGQVNSADLTEWLAEAGAANIGPGRPYRVGDANLDGIVDGSDFGLWNSNKFTGNKNWCQGNFNADSVTDGSDFGLWNSNKFTASDGNVVVPEPSSLLFCGAILVFLLKRRRA
jgi:hypothetical protein